MLRSIGLGALAAVCLIPVVGQAAQSAAPANGGLAPGIAPYTPPTPGSRPAAPPASPTASPTSPVSAGAPAAQAGAAVAVPSAADPATLSYVLGPRDKLRIIVYGEPDLTGEFTIAGDGELSFPLIGQVHAGGRSVDDLRNELVSRLSQGYLKDPRVSAEVLTFRPYYILGEVAKPGEYPYSSAITVINAVATAGGFTYRANKKIVFIKKPTDAKEEKVKLTGELTIEPGETIRVVERLF